MNKCLTIFFLILVLNSYSQVTYFPITKKGKWGIIDSSGKILLAPQFDYLSTFKKNIAVFKQNNLYGLVNSNGKKITSTGYNDINYLKPESIEQPLYLVNKNDKQGIINNLGIEVVPLKYTSLTKSRRCFIAKSQKNIVDIYKEEEGLIFSRSSDSIIAISHNSFISYEDSNKVLLDYNGNELHKDLGFTVERKPRGNLIVLSKNKMVFIDANFEKIIDTNLTFIKKRGSIYEFENNVKETVSYSFLLNRFFYNKNILTLEEFGKYIIINDNDKFGVIDTNNNQIVPFEFESIRLIGDYFYAKTFSNKVALFNLDFKMIIPPRYNNISVTKFGFIYKLNDKVGALNKKGNKITEARFNYINPNSIPVKCYLPEKGMVQLIFDNKWSFINKKEFSNYISLTTNLRNKFADLKTLNGDDSKRDSLSAKRPIIKYGWFSDSIEVIKEDSTRIKVEKWGLKNQDGVVVTKPTFKEYTFINDSISFAYRGKKQTGSSKKRIKDIPVLSSFTVVNHLTGEILIKQPFYALNLNGFINNNLISALNKNGICLIDKNFNLIEKNVHYARQPKDSMLLYSIVDKDKKALLLENKMVRKLDAWRSFGSGVDYDKNKSELYNFNVQSWRETYFKPYITNNIKLGFYNTLTNQKAFSPQFDYATNFTRGVSFVGNQKTDKDAVKYGVINKDRVFVPIEYDYVDYFDYKNYDQLYIVRLNNGKKLILDSLLNIKELKLTNIKRVNEDVIIAREKNKFGVLDDNFNWIVEPNYKKIIETETNNLIFKDKKYGVLAPNGNEISSPSIPKKYIVPLSKGALVYNNRTQKGKVYYYDYKLGELFKPISGVIYESGDLLLKVVSEVPTYYKNGKILKTNRLFSSTMLFKNGKYNIIKKGKKTKIVNQFSKEKIIKKDFIVQALAEEGVYFIKNNSKGLLSFEGDTLIKTDSAFSDIFRNDDNLLLTRSHINKQKYHYGLLTLEGKQILPCEFLKIEKVYDSVYFCFKKIGESVFLNPKGDTLKTLNCRDYNSGEYFLYKSGYRAYFLDSKLNPVFKYDFLDAEPFVKGIATVLTKEGWQVMNNKGTLISMGCFETMLPIAKNTIIAQEKPKFGLYNYKGEIVIPVEYEQIKGISSTVIQVIKEGKVGYITTQGKWLYNPF